MRKYLVHLRFEVSDKKSLCGLNESDIPDWQGLWKFSDKHVYHNAHGEYIFTNGTSNGIHGGRFNHSASLVCDKCAKSISTL